MSPSWCVLRYTTVPQLYWSPMLLHPCIVPRPSNALGLTFAQAASAVAVTAVKSQVQAVVAVPVVVAPSNAFILASKSSKVEKKSSMMPEPHWKTSPPTPMTPRTMEITRYLQKKKDKHIVYQCSAQ